MDRQYSNNDETSLFTSLGKHDVLVGRGAPSVQNPGNIRFRHLAQQHKAAYVGATKRYEKEMLARKLINEIRANGGRFVRKMDRTNPDDCMLLMKSAAKTRFLLPRGETELRSGVFYVSVDEAVIIDKVKQALREREVWDISALPPDDGETGGAVTKSQGNPKEEQCSEEGFPATSFVQQNQSPHRQTHQFAIEQDTSEKVSSPSFHRNLQGMYDTEQRRDTKRNRGLLEAAELGRYSEPQEQQAKRVCIEEKQRAAMNRIHFPGIASLSTAHGRISRSLLTAVGGTSSSLPAQLCVENDEDQAIARRQHCLSLLKRGGGDGAGFLYPRPASYQGRLQTGLSSSFADSHAGIMDVASLGSNDERFCTRSQPERFVSNAALSAVAGNSSYLSLPFSYSSSLRNPPANSLLDGVQLTGISAGSVGAAAVDRLNLLCALKEEGNAIATRNANIAQGISPPTQVNDGGSYLYTREDARNRASVEQHDIGTSLYQGLRNHNDLEARLLFSRVTSTVDNYGDVSSRLYHHPLPARRTAGSSENLEATRGRLRLPDSSLLPDAQRMMLSSRGGEQVEQFSAQDRSDLIIIKQRREALERLETHDGGGGRASTNSDVGSKPTVRQQIQQEESNRTKNATQVNLYSGEVTSSLAVDAAFPHHATSSSVASRPFSGFEKSL